ncbi:hypothetical protein OUZ56_028620 [Daphnia magna]|uniref:Uncharacterized protein n=1 Tax=Daphnia magna TaxID=35525 RepID=A0ABR0B503_9CRUS|nr:hypothetical protein OUZ56_028620 [Daphnia magna]
MQLLNMELGGTVERKDVCKDGQFEIQVETECLLFKGLETRQMDSGKNLLIMLICTMLASSELLLNIGLHSVKRLFP